MSPRASLGLLITAGVLASASADAAGLSPNLNIRSTGPTNTATLATGRIPGHGYPSYTPPPAVYGGPRPHITQFNSNDQFDTNGNINPGGGGGGTKPSKSPNLK
jgi:hypothetical protein